MMQLKLKNILSGKYRPWARLIPILLLLGVIFQSHGYAWTKLKHDLDGDKGYHFQHSFSKYSLSIDTKGAIYLGPSLSVSKNPKKDGLRLYYATMVKDKPQYTEYMEVKSKIVKNELTMQIDIVLENGQKAVVIILANDSKLSFETRLQGKENAQLRLGMMTAEANTTKNGTLYILSAEGKKIKQSCVTPYPIEDYIKTNFQSIFFDGRFPFNFTLNCAKGHGHINIVQYSADMGLSLNKALTVLWCNIPNKGILTFEF